MRVIEKSQFRDSDGEISFQNRLKGTLDYGVRWVQEMQAQLTVTRRLNKSLGDDYALIRNLTLPGTELILPLILIGPNGVRTMHVSPVRGVFRAKADEWNIYDSRRQAFKKARPNLQTVATAMSEAVTKHLAAHGYALPFVEPVLVFTHPRTIIDTARPNVRIVLADAIDHFASNVKQGEPVFDPEDIEIIVRALQEKTPAFVAAEEEERARAQAAAEAAAAAAQARKTEAEFVSPPLQPVDRQVSVSILPPFTPRQWIVLGVLAFFELIVLSALIIIVLANTVYA
jgi:hypothetical protein